jgi:hypothetical protein
METEKTFSGLKYEEMEAEWMWPLIMKPVPAYAMREEQEEWGSM